jgi:hypothetical protein
LNARPGERYPFIAVAGQSNRAPGGIKRTERPRWPIPLVLFARPHDERIGDRCLEHRQRRTSLPGYTTLIAAARDITLGVAQSNKLACLSNVRASANHADRLVYPSRLDAPRLMPV